MKNFVQSGDTLTLAAPYDVASGAGLLVGAIFAVAQTSAVSGAEVEAKRKGVFTLPALSTDTASVGAKLYWDNTNKRLTTTSSGNTLVGAATAAKASGDTTARILLDGVIR